MKSYAFDTPAQAGMTDLQRSAFIKRLHLVRAPATTLPGGNPRLPRLRLGNLNVPNLSLPSLSLKGALRYAGRVFAGLVVAAVTLTAAVLLSSIPAGNEILSATLWAAGFIFLALTLESSRPYTAWLVATGLALPTLAWLGSRIAFEFGLAGVAIVAAWLVVWLVQSGQQADGS